MENTVQQLEAIRFAYLVDSISILKKYDSIDKKGLSAILNQYVGGIDTHREILQTDFYRKIGGTGHSVSRWRSGTIPEVPIYRKTINESLIKVLVDSQQTMQETLSYFSRFARTEETSTSIAHQIGSLRLAFFEAGMDAIREYDQNQEEIQQICAVYLGREIDTKMIAEKTNKSRASVSRWGTGATLPPKTVMPNLVNAIYTSLSEEASKLRTQLQAEKVPTIFLPQVLKTPLYIG